MFYFCHKKVINVVYFFCVYQIVSICQIIYFYPRNCSFWENGPKRHKKKMFCPQSDYSLFSLGHFQHTCWMLCLYAQNCEFWDAWIVSYCSFSLFPTPAMLINAILSFIDLFSQVLAKKYEIYRRICPPHWWNRCIRLWLYWHNTCVELTICIRCHQNRM